MRKWQHDSLNNKEIAILMLFISSVILILCSLILGETLPVITTWSTSLIIAVAIAGAFNIANLFFTNYGFQHVNAVTASNLLNLESVFAVLLGIIFYNEFPTMKELLGGIFILISVYQMNKLE